MTGDINAKSIINQWLSESPEKVVAVKTANIDFNSINKLHLEKDSYLGVIVGDYSKLSLCNGYFSLLCSGEEDSIINLNALNEKGMPEMFPGALIIAYDTEGNLFAINSGAISNAKMGNILYLPANSFVWEDLELSYAQFMRWITHVTTDNLTSNEWKHKTSDKSVNDIHEFLLGKASAYNLFLRQW